MPSPQENNNELRGDIRELIRAVQTNRNDLASRMEELDRKTTAQTTLFESRIGDLRRELLSMFVSKAEYDPKHAQLAEKITRLEQQLEGGRPILDEFIALKGTVKQLVEDVEHVENDQSGRFNRLLPWLAAFISVVGFAITLLQHVQIK